MKPSDLPGVAPSTSALPGLTREIPAFAQGSVSPRLRTVQLPNPSASPRDLAAIKREIANDLASHPALQIVADILAFSIKQAESGDDEPAATAEYVASILLERPSEAPTSDAQEPDGKDSAIQRTLDRVRGLTLHGVEAGRRSAEGAAEPLAAIAENLKALDAVTRWPGYQKQITKFMTGCFTDAEVADQLSGTLRFDAQEAFACDQAVRELVVAGLNDWGQAVPALVQNELAGYESGEVPLPAALERSPTATPIQREAWLFAKRYFSAGLIEALSFSVDELAAAAGVDAQVAESFADRFSSPWGAAGGLTLLSGRNEVRRRPLLRGSDGRVHPTSVGNLLWALKPALEEALKDDRATFERYQRRRAALTESETSRLLTRALRPDFLFSNVDFSLAQSNGEADVLLRIDDTIVVAEAKAGGLSEAAYRGRSAAVRRDLGALLGKSSAQAARLQNAIEQGEAISFTSRASGQPLDVNLDGVQRVYAVVVTLEDLHPVLVSPQRLADAGILEGPLPWCVSLFDLEVITESTQFAAQFTSYLAARLSLDERVEWVDEADLWMTHLIDKLDYSRVRMPRFMVTDLDAPLAAQWMRGARPPRSNLPNATGKAMRRLERTRPTGWLAQSEDLFRKAQAHRRPRVKGPLQP